MKLNYVKGDLFASLPNYKGSTVLIPHVCNSIGAWGSGFVIPVMQHFPGAEKGCVELCKRWKNHTALGSTDYFNHVNDEGIIDVVICNMIAQKGIVGPGNPKPIKYRYLAECMYNVYNMAKAYQDQGDKVEIIAPKFGSDRAGGNWDFIEELIYELWIDQGIPVTVYYL